MPLRMRSWKAIIGVTVLVLVIFLIWRFIRPMNIFIVSEAFERPIDTTTLPATLRSLLRGGMRGMPSRALRRVVHVHTQSGVDRSLFPGRLAFRRSAADL